MAIVVLLQDIKQRTRISQSAYRSPAYGTVEILPGGLLQYALIADLFERYPAHSGTCVLTRDLRKDLNGFDPAHCVRAHELVTVGTGDCRQNALILEQANRREPVVAVGNAYGYEHTVTQGIISALHRAVQVDEAQDYDDLIQTDASINPGNSGGPLLNIAGELIGINTAIRPDAQGIGFAIPVDLLTNDLARLLDFERLNRVVVGLSVRQRRTSSGDQLVVTSVTPGSPAAQAGCRVGDRLLALDGRPVRQLPDYQIPMLSARAGQKVRLKCLRGGKTVQVVIQVKARPKPDGAALARRLFGLELQTLTPEIARRLRLAVGRGLLVTAVQRNGPAHRLGLAAGDVIFQLGRWQVTDLDDVGAVLEDVEPGTLLRIGYVRGNIRFWTLIRARRIQTSPPGKAKLAI